MENLDWKDKLASAFGIDVSSCEQETEETPKGDNELSGKQDIRISLDRRNRKGKSVTIIYNIEGSDEAIDALAKELKVKCGAGGSSRGGEILIQGDVRTKVQEYLSAKGLKSRIV